MVASNTEIANLALSKLGASRLLDLDTDDTKAARAMRACFESVRDDEVSNYPWKFAMTRTTLPALADAPPWGFKSQFQSPADCVRLVQINDFDLSQNQIDYRQAPAPSYQLEGSLILTDLPAPLKVRYLRRVTDPALMDASFVQALACRLAAETCEEILQSAQKKSLLLQEYRGAVRSAWMNDAIEKSPEAPADDSWIMGRL